MEAEVPNETAAEVSLSSASGYRVGVVIGAVFSVIWVGLALVAVSKITSVLFTMVGGFCGFGAWGARRLSRRCYAISRIAGEDPTTRWYVRGKTLLGTTSDGVPDPEWSVVLHRQARRNLELPTAQAQ